MSTSRAYGDQVLAWRLKAKASRTAINLIARQEWDVPVERLGSSYGGWWVPSGHIGHDTILYSIGAGEDITFDIEMLHRGCSVLVVDPTPRAITHVESQGPVGHPRFRFLPVGLAGYSGTRRFYAPRDPAHVSHSVSNLQGTATFFDAECLTPADLMARAGDYRVDVLKLDIEGAEHEVLESLLQSEIRPAALCVEFDDPSIRMIRRSLRALRRAGYRVVKVDGRNVTLLWS